MDSTDPRTASKAARTLNVDDTVASTDQSSRLGRRLTRTLRGPLQTLGYTRSISLPQALHSFSLTDGRSKTKSRLHSKEGSASSIVNNSNGSYTDSNNSSSGSGSGSSASPTTSPTRSEFFPESSLSRTSSHASLAAMAASSAAASSSAAAQASQPQAGSKTATFSTHSASTQASSTAIKRSSGYASVYRTTPNFSPQPGPQPKRAISENHTNGRYTRPSSSRTQVPGALPIVSEPFGTRVIRPLGRSETTPQLGEILRSEPSMPQPLLPGKPQSPTSAAAAAANATRYYFTPSHQRQASEISLDPASSAYVSPNAYVSPTASPTSSPQLRSERIELYSNPSASTSVIEWQDASDVFNDSFDSIGSLETVASVDTSLESVYSSITGNDSDLSLGLCVKPPVRESAAQRALSNPDILRCIFNALDALTIIPHELVQQRRKPVSLRHAQFIFGDNKRASEAWETTTPATSADGPGAGLYNCLLVNSMWYDAAARVMETRIFFKETAQWTQFARRGVDHLSRKPRMLVLHKLNDATQVELEMLESKWLGEHLEWLEFYTCTGLAPPPSLLGHNLQRIMLPGCYRVDDRTLSRIAERCPRLEHLDVRACEQVSDRGIKMIAKFCPQLQMLNVGRTQGGDQITYKGIKHLARQTQISSLGIAGCHIDDRAIWELALNRGPKLQRLSLNNCHLLTDASVPRVLGYMPKLTVLEIRGCISITHMRPLALFKEYRETQGQSLLIEGCEVIERRLKMAIMRLQKERCQRVLSDLASWTNSDAE